MCLTDDQRVELEGQELYNVRPEDALAVAGPPFVQDDPH